MSGDGPFHGAKRFLFIGADLVVIRRDDIPTIPWPGLLDLPGGGRDGDETAEACVIRETFEELGLRIKAHQLTWRCRDRNGVYFAAHLPAGAKDDIVFGNEGQGWHMMATDTYLTRPDVIPHHTQLLRRYLSSEQAVSKRLW